jgi:uncharacterized protein (DUF169 family)
MEVNVKVPELANRIVDVLELDTPPIGVTFVQDAPADITEGADTSPSACGFWPRAQSQAFYAPAAAHFNCPVGAMVMGFELPAEVQQQLGQLVEDMSACHYVSPDEPPKIPTVGTQHAGIVYTPLAETDSTPDVVLLWATPRQAMLCNEAMGTAKWTVGGPTVTGRPACAALPLAMSSNSPVMSLGCAGMRTFTEIADDRMLFAVPGGQLESFTQAVDEIGQANRHMGDFYRARRDQLMGDAARAD